MTDEEPPGPAPNDDDERTGLVLVCALAALSGMAIGFVGGAFRRLLIEADGLRHELVDWAHSVTGPSWLVPILVTAAGAGIGRYLVKLAPLAGGSGVQHVEAVWRGESEPPTWRVVPVRFFGGLIAIGSGLVLGREGPTVHMGATIGAELGRQAKVGREDVRLLQAAPALYVSPLSVGGGDPLTQLLLSGNGGPGALVVGSLVGYFLIRFLVGPLSYAAGAPAACSRRCWPSAPCGVPCSTPPSSRCSRRPARRRFRGLWWG